MSKKRIQPAGTRRITGVVLVVFGLLALATLVVYVARYYVSRADYTHATERTNSAVIRYNALQSALGGYIAAAQNSETTSATLSEKSANFTTALSDYQSAIGDIKHERALNNQSVRAAYTTVVEKSTSYTNRLVLLAATLPVLHSKSVNCSKNAIGRMDTGDLGKLTSVYDAVATPCVEVMQKLAKSGDQAAKAAGEKGLAYFSDMRKHIVAMQDAYAAGNRSVFEAEYKAFLASANNFSVGTDTSTVTNLERLGTSADALNALAKTLQEKVGP